MSQFRPVSDGAEGPPDIRVCAGQKPNGAAQHVGKIRAGSPRVGSFGRSLGRSGRPRKHRRDAPSPESCLACAGYGPPEVDLFEEDSAGAHDDGDWWFGLITGVGICLILWWVVDRHRRR